jgi:hypothetical protein
MSGGSGRETLISRVPTMPLPRASVVTPSVAMRRSGASDSVIEAVKARALEAVAQGSTDEFGIQGLALKFFSAEQRGDTEAGIEIARQIRQLLERDPSLKAKHSSLYFAAMGALYQAASKDGRDDEALNILTQLVDKDASIFPSGVLDGMRLNRASMLQRLGDNAAAAHDLDLLLDSPSPTPLVEAGRAGLVLSRIQMRDPDGTTSESVRELDRNWAIAKNDHDYFTLSAYAISYLRGLVSASRSAEAVGVYFEWDGVVEANRVLWAESRGESAVLADTLRDRRAGLLILADAYLRGSPEVSWFAIKQLRSLFPADQDLMNALDGYEAAIQRAAGGR